MIPAQSVYNTGREKTTRELGIRADELATEFQQALSDQGLIYKKDTGSLLYQLMEDYFVNVPLAEYRGENPYDLVPYQAQSAARYLARGGETGPIEAKTFLEAVSDRTWQQWISGGIGSSGKATSSHPVLAFLSPLKRDAAGWNYAPGVQEAWITYAKYDWAVRQWAKETETINEKTGESQGIATSSTTFKKKYQEVMAPVIAKLSTIAGWKDEYEWSQLRLDQRLAKFGVGSGTTPEDKTMGEFLKLSGPCGKNWPALRTLTVRRNRGSRRERRRQHQSSRLTRSGWRSSPKMTPRGGSSSGAHSRWASSGSIQRGATRPLTGSTRKT